jgi:hypothetical protein
MDTQHNKKRDNQHKKHPRVVLLYRVSYFFALLSVIGLSVIRLTGRGALMKGANDKGSGGPIELMTFGR